MCSFSPFSRPNSLPCYLSAEYSLKQGEFCLEEWGSELTLQLTYRHSLLFTLLLLSASSVSKMERSFEMYTGGLKQLYNIANFRK